MICSYFFRTAKGKIPDLCSNICRVIFLLCLCLRVVTKFVAQARAARAGEAAAARCSVVPTPGRRACRARGARRNLRRDFFNDRRLSAPLPDKPIFDAPSFHLMWRRCVVNGCTECGDPSSLTLLEGNRVSCAHINHPRVKYTRPKLPHRTALIAFSVLGEYLFFNI